MIDFNHSEIAAYYASRVPGLRQTSHREWRGKCPVHDGDGDNFAVNSETGQAKCHSQCQRGWDLLSLEQELNRCDFIEAKRRVFELLGRPEPDWQDRDVQATYDYRGPDGEISYQVVRRVGKKFAQRRPDGRGGWRWGLGDAKPLPFQLPVMRAAEFVAIVEGEKDALNLTRAGIVATCNNGGAGNFKADLVPWFRDKRVMILPDNDDPGRQHALKVAAMLSGMAATVRIVEIPNLPAKGDVSDFLDRGGDVEALAVMFERAQDWTPEWAFTADVPDENDRYVRTLAQEIEAAGGLDAFWDFRRQPGVPTPWSRLTEALAGGMRRGEVYVLGANQGAGKTSLGLQFILKALRSRFGVLLFSMEMGWREVFHRLIALEARVDLLDYQKQQRKGGQLYGDREELDRYTQEIKSYALTVSTKTGVTPEYIAHESDRIRKRQPVDMVVVDHMQLMASTASVRGDYEKFTAISRAMKETAKNVDAPVLLISQTSRNQAHDKRAELEVSDLRGSGAIEEDAAAVMLLYPDRDDALRAMGDQTFPTGPVLTWLKLGKNRYGLSGAYFQLQHNKRYTRFDQVEYRTESA